MSRYTGGIIKNGGIIPTTLSASGIWTISDYTRFRKSSQWPENTLYTFTTFTFTNANLTGRLGPSLSTLLTSYNTSTNPWLTNINYFSMPSYQGYQLWTVPKSGLYRFVVTGATRGSGSTKGASAKMTATIELSMGAKLWIVCGQQGLTQNESGDGASWVALSNNGDLSGSSPLIVAGGAGDYSYYASEPSYQTGQSFSDAQTTDNLNTSVLGVTGMTTPTTGNGGTAFVPSGQIPGYVTGGGGFNSNGAIISGATNLQTFGRGFFDGLYGGMPEATTIFDTTTTAGGGFGGAGGRGGGFGTGGGGGYTGGSAAGSTNTPGPQLRRSTGGSSYIIGTATNTIRELASPSAPNATAQQGSVQITLL